MDGVALRRSIARCVEDARSSFSVCVIVLQDGGAMGVQIGRANSSDSMWEAIARGQVCNTCVCVVCRLCPDRYVVVCAV